MNRSCARAVMALVAALSLAASLATAQTAPAPSSAPPKASPTYQTRPARVGYEVYQKLRPATFQLNVDDGLGTGYFINADGLALTAYHVVFNSKSLSARTPDGKRYPASVVGYDDSKDVALVQVKVNGPVPFIPLAVSEPKVGDAVLAIGNGDSSFNNREVFLAPKFGNVRKVGVTSIRGDFASGTLELSALLAPGDSGGPVINARGEAVGVVSYIRGVDEEQGGTDTTLQRVEGVPLVSDAVPVTSASPLLADLRRGVKRDAPVIGIGLQGQVGQAFDNFPPELFAKTGLGPKPGVLFNVVAPGSPAEKAGLRPLVIVKAGDATSLPTLKGDVILAVDGQSVREFLDLLNLVRAHQVGDVITLSVQRGDQTVQVKVTLAGRAGVEANR